MADIVQCTVFLTDIDDYQEMNEAYVEYFPSELPARTAIAAVAVPASAQMEIACIAAISREVGDMRREPCVILIREWEQQLSGSGCCGRVEGYFLSRDGQSAFPERRACMDAMGPLYLALRDRFGDELELHVVDPRNSLSMIFLLLRDFWAFRVGVGDALKTISRLSIQASVVNGRLVSHGEWPDPMEVIRIIEEAISETAPQPA